LGILRWIIASNRSCIVQVDICPGQTDEEVAKAKIRLDQKCTNVNDNYVQFRFAQGAPDKEQRFLQALKDQQYVFSDQFLQTLTEFAPSAGFFEPTLFS
jgi:ubiquitin-conjugating enzyme E2 Q